MKFIMDVEQRVFEVLRYEENRLKTFQMNPPWPKDYIDIKKLAKAGLYYILKQDKVQCIFCQGVLYDWEPDDDPMQEHIKNYLTCPFVMGGDVGNVPLGEDPFPEPKRPRPYDVCGPSTETNLVCKICYTNKIQLLFTPCYHSVACISCAGRLRSCPLCRSPVVKRIRAYIP